jgi:hypothetical protein
VHAVNTLLNAVCRMLNASGKTNLNDAGPH